MKAIALALIIIFGGSEIGDVGVDKKVSKRIYKAQRKEMTFASSAYDGRKQLINLSTLNYSPTIDTLFLIERVGEPSLEVWGNVWTSRRDIVVEYNNDSGAFKLSVLNYQEWNSSLKSKSEVFDTTTIDKHKILGGYRTFLTQVIGRSEVKTFFFHDSRSSFDQYRL